MVFQKEGQEAYLVRNGNKAVFTVITHPDKYTSIENGPVINGRQEKVFVFHSREKIDSLSRKVFKISLLELEKRCAMKFYGELKDPNTHITSIFAYATLNGNVVENKSLVNGKLWSTVNVGSLVTSYGKKGVGYKYHWRYLNECGVVNTVESNSQGIGNMGQCGQSGYFSPLDAKAKTTTINDGVPFAYNPVTNTATMDPSKKRIVIIYMGGEVISGKEESNQAYLDLDTGICTTFAK